MTLTFPIASILPLLVACNFPVVAPPHNPIASREPARASTDQIMAVDQAEQISMYVREVFQDRDGDYWFGTNGEGVCRYDGKSLAYFSVEEGFGGWAVRGILQDANGAMWFGTDGGVSRFESGSFTNYTTENGLSDNSVWSMFLDSRGTIWAGTHEGVCHFDGKSFVPFVLPSVEVENLESRFSPKVVFSMYEDPEGNLWFGTDGEGVCKYDGKSFTTYTTKDGLAGNVVRSICGDRHGRIWIGTNGGGASCYDGKTFKNFTEKDGLSNNRIYEILEDRAGNMWFSTLGAGACRYDGKSFTAFPPDENLILYDRPARGHVQEFFEDKDGILWLGCSGGLFRFEGETIINVTREGPWPERKPAETKGTVPMEDFSRMVSGEWRVTFLSGTSMFDTWNWGPGQHSMHVQTRGSGAAGERWRGLRVYYWHPGLNQVSLFGLSPFRRGVSEGSIKFEGETADGVFDLYQGGGKREMGFHWSFDGPDKYRGTLLEATGTAGLEPINGLNYVRSKKRTSSSAHTAADAPEPSKHLAALDSLVGHTWEAEFKWSAGMVFLIKTTFEWVPHADYIHARVVAVTKDDESTHMLDAYIYHHNGTGALQCLALSKWGGVYEGNLTVHEDGALQFDLKGYEGDEVVSYAMQLDFEKGGTLRDRIWSVESEGRRLVSDVQHTK